MEDISHQKAKQAKYHLGGVYRKIVDGFFIQLKALLEQAPQAEDDKTLLEVGCGEGEVLERISTLVSSEWRVLGVDIDFERLRVANSSIDWARFSMGSAYTLPLRDAGASLVICCEVLEHLDYPELALREVDRVLAKGGSVIFSVPNEPLWRCLNFLRGKYILSLGNTPGHINHWGQRKFVKMIASVFEVQEVATPLPWIMMLATKRQNDGRE